jgi:capsular exopolysaccharide synthesis family protein
MARLELTAGGTGDRWSRPVLRQPEQTSEEGIRLGDALGVLRRNLGLIALITAITTGGTFYFLSQQVPLYRATAVIRLTDARGALTGGIGGTDGEKLIGRGSDPLLSQLEVLKGRTVLGEVIDREGLRLASVPAVRIALSGSPSASTSTDTVQLHFTDGEVTAESGGQTTRAPYGAPLTVGGLTMVVPARPEVPEARVSVLPRDLAIDDLARNLAATPRGGTDAVEVQYTSSDPALAQRVVNTAISVFQSASADAAQQQSRRRRLFLQAQLSSVDSVLATMQNSLSAFRSENQVFSSRDKISTEQSGLMSLDVQLEELAADRKMYQTLLSQIAARGANRQDVVRTLVSSPGVASNPVVTQLYTQLVQYETARDSLMTGALGATVNHPDVQRLAALITSTQDRLIDAVRSHVSAVDARIAALSGLRARNAGEIATLPTTEAEEVRLVQQVETTQRMGDELRGELQRARIEEAVEAGQVEVVNAAPLPIKPLNAGRSLKLALGLAFGLFLGGGLAFAREHLNTTIRRREDVEDALQVPGLAVIPQISSGRGVKRFSVPMRLALPGRNGRSEPGSVGNRELVTVSDLQSSGAEAFRMLRTNLLFSQSVGGLKTIVVTSATPGEGKTTTSANLAATFAQQGMRALLVDCDLRRARLHRMFGIDLAPGLTEMILGHNPAQEMVRPTDVPGLWVLPAGTLPPNPAELLGGSRMKRALQLLSEQYDVVVLDTPPLMAAADAAILGAGVDGVVLVVRAGQTERGAAQFAMQQLHGVGARVLGAVLNDPDAQVPLYGGYYYYNYYATETA